MLCYLLQLIRSRTKVSDAWFPASRPIYIQFATDMAKILIILHFLCAFSNRSVCRCAPWCTQHAFTNHVHRNSSKFMWSFEIINGSTWSTMLNPFTALSLALSFFQCCRMQKEKSENMKKFISAVPIQMEIYTLDHIVNVWIAEKMSWYALTCLNKTNFFR